jgi:AraC-like DNA-binding protein
MGRMAVMHHDSPLGRWTRALYFPDSPLAAHIEVFWHVSGRANFSRDRRLPTGNAHLLFNLGSPPTLFAREAGAASRSFPTCWIAGQCESYIETGSHGETVLLGAQFCSHGAWRLLRLAQDELRDQVVELESLLGDRIRRLHQRLLDTPTPQACFVLLEQWLLALLERGSEIHAGVQAACQAISLGNGRVDLRELSRRTGFSREHLIRRFREQVGLTPKAYANILRFNHALASAHRCDASWAEIALDCGYYDQAHLIRDFQRYAGRAPSSLLRDRRPDAASVVID